MHAFLSVVVAAAFLSPAIAQEATTAHVLGGPKVDEAAASHPLVTTDYEGRIRRLDVWPEIEALKHIDLSPEMRDAADRALAARARLLDDVIIQNVDLLIKLNTASAAGRKADSLLLLAEAFGKLRPVREAGTVRDLLAESLPADKVRAMDRLARQYWEAIVGERKAASAKEGRLAILLDENFKIFGKEIEDSFTRQLNSEERQIEFYIRYLKLRPEQEKRVRRIISDAYARAEGELTKEQRDALLLAIIAHLDEKQRDMLSP